MKKIAATAVCVALVASGGQARAQCGDCAKEWTQVASWAKQARDAASQISWATQQWRTLNSTYAAISHATNVEQIGATLGGVARTYMPDSGTSTLGMLGGAVVDGAEMFQGANRLYRSPASADAWQTEANRVSTITANAQAIAAAGLQDSQSRVDHLKALEIRLGLAKDGTEVAAVQGELALEQQNLAAHQKALDDTRLLLAADDRVTAQRQEELQRRSADHLLQATQPLGDGE